MTISIKEKLTAWTVRLVSAGGIIVIVTFGFVFSKSRRRVVWRHVIWGLSLQFLFGLLILRWDYGRMFFNCTGDKIDTFLEFTDAGSSFVFGYLVNQQPFIPSRVNNSAVQNILQEINDSRAVNSIVVFKALSTVYFFRNGTNILISCIFPYC